MPSRVASDPTSKPKRHRKSKARTEVSSPSSSDSEDRELDASKSTVKEQTSHAAVHKSKKNKKLAVEKQSDLQDSLASVDKSEAPQRSIPDNEAENAFTSLYLRQLTSEFDKDLDKLRSASDFKDQNLPMLIDALKQGRSCFDKQTRLDVGRSAAASTS